MPSSIDFSDLDTAVHRDSACVVRRCEANSEQFCHPSLVILWQFFLQEALVIFFGAVFGAVFGDFRWSSQSLKTTRCTSSTFHKNQCFADLAQK
jgi:hypothetical protein